MLSNDKIHRALCISQLASNSDFSVFKQIVHTSRQRNGQLGLTGVLVFDGERFCHLLEGPQDPFDDVMRRIAADPRHTVLSMLYPRTAVPSRLLYTWRSGYCSPEDLDQFASPGGLHGDDALLAFMGVLTRCDLAG